MIIRCRRERSKQADSMVGRSSFRDDVSGRDWEKFIFASPASDVFLHLSFSLIICDVEGSCFPRQGDVSRLGGSRSELERICVKSREVVETDQIFVGDVNKH